MRTRPAAGLDVLSISALDLFASALGVFILIAVILFPYYLQEPAVDVDLERARTAAAAAEAARLAAADEAKAIEREREEAERALAAAEAEKAAAEQTLAEMARRVAAVPQPAAPRPAPAAPVPAPKPVPGITIGPLDLVFVVDATGSMRDEIRDIQRSLLSIIRVLDRLAPSLAIGFVAFRDRGDAFLTQTFPLTAMTPTARESLQGFVRRLDADGGGDEPEPVGAALRQAAAMAWRPDAKGRIVVVSDAPSHIGTWAETVQLAAAFRASAGGSGRDRRVSAIFTGRKGQARQFYEQLTAQGGGDLVTHRGRILESVLLSVL